MNWPFGGIPLGGVFLGQADGPVLGVARLGGPLALTATVFIGGVGVGALGSALARAARDAVRVRSFARADLGGPGWWPAGNEAADRVGTLTGALAGTGTLVTTGVVALVLVALLATRCGPRT